MAIPDILPGWACTPLSLVADRFDPPPVAHLVHRPGTHFAATDFADGARPSSASGSRSRAVLYVHGFVDYFFQDHMAREWEEHGWDFYALDLRDCGRSIQEGRIPHYVEDLKIYDEEITAAIALMRHRGAGEVVLMGHSTGGLIVSLYAQDHVGFVDGLVLNSPWFDLNSPWFERVVAARVIEVVVAAIAPFAKVSRLNPLYGKSLHQSSGGEWDFNLDFKPHAGFAVRARWLAAIRKGHRRIARGLDLQIPVLVMTSGRSGDNNKPTQGDLDESDVVLNVADMQRLAKRLGNHVGVARIQGGRHDLSLSAAPVREKFFTTLFHWLDRVLPSSTQ